ncbi:MAG: transcriptional repressor [Bacteroidaceae bacterium]|nr:transcriptional repressor [Bacteroidaceae bacterium]
MGEASNSAAAYDRLGEYLQLHKLRRTPERFAILETACTFNGHFTLQALKEKVTQDKHILVSTATMYNTVSLLADAGLIVRHRLGGMTEYEVVHLVGESHLHLVCIECGKIRELHDERLQRYMRDIRTGKFVVSSYTLYFYGLCAKCVRSMRYRKEKMLETDK